MPPWCASSQQKTATQPTDDHPRVILISSKLPAAEVRLPSHNTTSEATEIRQCVFGAKNGMFGYFLQKLQRRRCGIGR